MENFYDFIVNKGSFNTINLNELTFAEYNCPIHQTILPVWTPHDYIVHVLNGRKTWHTIAGIKTLSKGETAYIKKGGHIVHQHFEDEFCLLIIFIKDEFKSLLNLDDSLKGIGTTATPVSTILYELTNNPSILGYYHSILSYFQMAAPPSDAVIKLKFQELIHILATEPTNHVALRNMVCLESNVLQSLKTIMFQNFTYNLSLENFAALCNRSLSTFKRDFMKCFQTTPGKWLNETRMRKASSLLINTDMPITQIAFDCGFENLSHFSKSFKLQFKISPKNFREKYHLASNDNRLTV